ncbi:Phosphoglycolate phosphatase [hydrothermal vent metagenome]|uniref:phosphoglycolate phosphatase n=1 Tax=hydrothermal vent metagenome TaxID=652676 RepID=A0A3B0TD21_9ZZZZ
MPTPATIVFDLDGTLIDTAPDLAATMNELLRRRGRGSLPTSAIRTMVGHGAKAMMEAGMAATGAAAGEAELDDMFAEFIEYYSDNIAVQSQIFPGALAALDRLEAEGYRLAMCTNKMEALSRKLIGSLGLEGRFASLLGGDTLAFRKPDPRHLTETIVQAGGDVGNAILVGDSIADVSAAKAASVPVIGVSFGYTKIPMAELAPDRVIDHFDDLDAAVAEIFARK